MSTTEKLESLDADLFRPLSDEERAALSGGWLSFDFGASGQGRNASDAVDDAGAV
jgi:hypothetical protein